MALLLREVVVVAAAASRLRCCRLKAHTVHPQTKGAFFQLPFF